MPNPVNINAQLSGTVITDAGDAIGLDAKWKDIFEAQIVKPLIWVRSDTVTTQTSGTDLLVNTWSDWRSPAYAGYTGAFSQATTTRMPKWIETGGPNGIPVVRFDGALSRMDLINVTLAANSAYTFIVIGKLTTPSAFATFKIILGYVLGTDARAIHTDQAGTLWHRQGTGTISRTNAAVIANTTRTHVLMACFDGVSYMSSYADATERGYSTAGTLNTQTGIGLGNSWNGTNSNVAAGGDIMDVAIYAANLDIADYQYAGIRRLWGQYAAERAEALSNL